MIEKIVKLVIVDYNKHIEEMLNQAGVTTRFDDGRLFPKNLIRGQVLLMRIRIEATKTATGMYSIKLYKREVLIAIKTVESSEIKMILEDNENVG